MKPSNTNNNELSIFIEKFLPYAEKKLGFNKPPTIKFQDDHENAKDIFGKTAYYEPGTHQIVLFTTGRHSKDILRSLSHELVHHTQNCRGEFQNMGATQEGYAQNDPHLRKMEKEAYLYGNIIFRDFCDSQLHETSYNKGVNTMTEDILKETINKAVRSAIRGSEKARKQLQSVLEGEDMPVDKKETLEEESKGIFAPNHYCIHHGGVHHNGKIEMAEAVNHNYDEVLGRVTHYDMKLKDGTILENIAFEDIQVTNASLAEDHDHAMKRDNDKKDDDKKKKKSNKKPDGDGDGVPPWADKDDDDPEVQEEAQDEEEVVLGEKPLKEWYDNSLYKKLIKEYTRRK
tara:strand:- start:117 stop:1148 length:1032 start_codon:yes stop_codon:yes gene_type:complete